MKTKKSIGLLTAFCVLTTSSVTAFAGGGAGSHAGDMLVSEFTGSARLIAAEIARLGNPISCVDSTALLGTKEKIGAIDETYVQSSFSVFKEGKEEDAWNSQDLDGKNKKIEISRSRLINATDNLNYLTLVLHEYYGILGLETSHQFNRSQGCMQQLQILGADLVKLRYRVNPLSGTIEEFVKGNLKFRCSPNERNRTTGKYMRSYWNMLYAYSALGTNMSKRSVSLMVFQESASGFREPFEKSIRGANSLETRLRFWNVSYDVSTGLTSVTMDVPVWYRLNTDQINPEGQDAKYVRAHRLTYVSDGRVSVEYLMLDNAVRSFVSGDCTSLIERTYGN